MVIPRVNPAVGGPDQRFFERLHLPRVLVSPLEPAVRKVELTAGPISPMLGLAALVSWTNVGPIGPILVDPWNDDVPAYRGFPRYLGVT